MRPFVLLAVVLAQAGCAWRPGTTLSPPEREAQPPGVARPAQQGTGQVSRKSVTGKEAPNKLFAVDGTACIVPERQFRETEIGSTATCIWSRN